LHEKTAIGEIGWSGDHVMWVAPIFFLVAAALAISDLVVILLH